MTDQRPDPDPTDRETIEDIAELQGDPLPIDQDAVLEPDEIEGVREPTRTELDHGAPDRGPDDTVDRDDLQAFAGRGLREGETDDADVATEEGLPWVPPTDPPFDLSRETDDTDPDLVDRVRSAILADAATSELVDRVHIVVGDRRAVVRGSVATVFDADALVTVIERVDGIDEVVDETSLAE